MAAAQKGGARKVCVAAAEDPEVLKALAETEKTGLTQGLLLVGRREKIVQILKENLFSTGFEIVDASSDEESVEKASALVKDGAADIIMKGLVNSSVFMKGILNKETGLRTENIISHLACFELPGYERLLFCSDGGINVEPDLDRKMAILKNALDALGKMGYQEPKAALLAANEMVDPKIAATRDAADIMRAYGNGAFGSCVVEGPIALDTIFSPEAARHKGIDSKISGKVDLILYPSMEVGNALGKSWLHFNQAKWAGLVLGASKPVLMGSRSDSFEAKVNGIALACMLNSLNEEH